MVRLAPIPTSNDGEPLSGPFAHQVQLRDSSPRASRAQIGRRRLPGSSLALPMHTEDPYQPFAPRRRVRRATDEAHTPLAGGADDADFVASSAAPTAELRDLVGRRDGRPQ